MLAQVMCPNLQCRRVLAVPESARGKVVKCQHCQTLLKVPSQQQAETIKTAEKSH